MIVTKTVCQHSEKLPEETMRFLRGIAKDYAKVKTAVYERYSGIRSIERINHIYDLQRDMRNCGLRQQLKLPVAYYEMAVVEAVANIKAMWGGLKQKIREFVRGNSNLTNDDRMYIRTVLKLDTVFAAILNRRSYDMPRNADESKIDAKRLNNIINRVVRRHIVKPKIHGCSQFKVVPAGYKYKDNGIYLVNRVPRKRIYIPLKDDTVSSRQIRICVLEDHIDIQIPKDIEVMCPGDFVGKIFAHVGYRDALTLSNGHIYGKDLHLLVEPETERLSRKNIERNKVRAAYDKCEQNRDKDKAKRIKDNNLGKKKYDRQKFRVRERTQNYINAEINRMFSEEKPEIIVTTEPIIGNRRKYRSKDFNRKMNRSFGGYIRKRLEEKCNIRGVKLVLIGSKDTGHICSKCGAPGKIENGQFVCNDCGYETNPARNSAKNIENKAIAAGVVS